MRRCTNGLLKTQTFDRYKEGLLGSGKRLSVFEKVVRAKSVQRKNGTRNGGQRPIIQMNQKSKSTFNHTRGKASGGNASRLR